jgi:hypothetical protein
MDIKEKKDKIKDYVIDMLYESYSNQLKKLNKVLDSNCLDIDNWDISNAPMVLPKSIVVAILETEVKQYEAPKTYPKARSIKKEINNIKLFI